MIRTWTQFDGIGIGVFWVWVWVSTGSWPVLFAAIWLVVALTNPRRQPYLPGVATWRWLRTSVRRRRLA